MENNNFPGYLADISTEKALIGSHVIDWYVGVVWTRGQHPRCESTAKGHSRFRQDGDFSPRTVGCEKVCQFSGYASHRIGTNKALPNRFRTINSLEIDASRMFKSWRVQGHM